MVVDIGGRHDRKWGVISLGGIVYKGFRARWAATNSTKAIVNYIRPQLRHVDRRADG